MFIEISSLLKQARDGHRYVLKTAEMIERLVKKEDEDRRKAEEAKAVGVEASKPLAAAAAAPPANTRAVAPVPEGKDRAAEVSAPASASASAVAPAAAAVAAFDDASDEEKGSDSSEGSWMEAPQSTRSQRQQQLRQQQQQQMELQAAHNRQQSNGGRGTQREVGSRLTLIIPGLWEQHDDVHSHFCICGSYGWCSISSHSVAPFPGGGRRWPSATAAFWSQEGGGGGSKARSVAARGCTARRGRGCRSLACVIHQWWQGGPGSACGPGAGGH